MSVYNIYISNFTDPFESNNPFVASERLLYTVPIVDSECALTDPMIKVEMGKTGSFEFSIHPKHPYYNSWLQMKTILRVTYAGETLFRGRVLTIDNAHMTGVKKIHLEGDFAFLMDSYQEGIKDDDRTERSLETYLEEIISSHNSQMSIANENYKKIYLGEVPGNYTSATSSAQRIVGETRKFGGSSWRKSSDALNEIQAEFGGYFRTRYDENNGRCYLDWLNYYFNPVVNSQPIQLKENLVDLSSTTEVENLFTALIPIGSEKGNSLYIDGYKTDIHGNNKYILVPNIVSQFSDSELNSGYHSKADYMNAIDNYGIIFLTQSFSNADTKDKLWTYAIDWIKNNYVGGISSFSVSAFDMHHVDANSQPYFVGDQIRVIYPNTNAHTSGSTPTIEKTLTITSIQYDLHHPEKDTYDVGIPNSILNKTYGKPSKTSSGGGASAKVADKPAGGGVPKKPTPEEQLQDYEQLVWDFIVSETYNNEDFISYKEKYGDENLSHLLKTAHEILVDEIKINEQTPAGEVERVKTTRNIVLNAPNLTLEMYNPKSLMNVPPSQRTIDQINDFNKNAQTLILDGDKSLLSLAQRAKVDPYDPTQRAATFAERQLMQVSGNAENGNKPGLTAWPTKKVDENTQDPLSVAASMLLDGGTDSDKGNASFGQDNNNNWITTLNKNIVWTDNKGQTHTIKGGIHAEDFHVDDIGSFHTKFAAIDELVAKKATIEQLEAVEATIETLKAKAITTDTLTANLRAYTGHLNAGTMNCGGNLSAGGITIPLGSFSFRGRSYSNKTQPVVTGVKLLADGILQVTTTELKYFGG